MDPENLKPFLKWPGGKRWIAPTIALILGDRPRRYFEPFLGGAAVFFALNPRRAYLSDINEDLVTTYEVVRTQPEPLIRRLSRLAVNRRTFMNMRRLRPSDPLGRASRFLYLNRTAFNGLFRVNRMGRFNVPYGCKPGTTPCDASAIRRSSRHLRTSSVSVADFRAALADVRPGDVIYADPPYTVMHNHNAFRRYNESLFSWQDQQALAASMNRLAAIGACVVVTNAFHPAIDALYQRNLFVRTPVRRPSNIAANPAYRIFADELLLLSRSIIDDSNLLREIMLDLDLPRPMRIRSQAE